MFGGKPVIYALAVSCLMAVFIGNDGLRWGLNDNPNYLVGLAQVVNATVNVSSKTPGANTAYFWDLMPARARSILLNQTAVQVVFNVTTKVLADSYFYMRWAQLPLEVQNVLYNQKQNTTSYMSMTFGSLNLANASDPRYNLTIETFLAPFGRKLLQNATALLNPLQYNTSVDVVKLPKLLNKLRGYYTNYIPRSGLAWDRIFKDLPAFTRPSSTRNADVDRYYQYVFTTNNKNTPYSEITRMLFASLIGLFDWIVYAPPDLNYWLI